MADIPNRDELERKLARILGRLQKAQMGRLLEYMGDPPSLDRVPPEFWDEIGAELGDALRPFLGDVYTDAARRMIEAGPVGVEWTLVNQRAADWARQYTFRLVKGINDHTRDALQHAVSGYFERGQTIGELEEQISGLFGPVRASMIATTEITRASVEGEREIADELRAEGIDMVEVWQTQNDERVCELCGPLHGKQEGDGWTKVDGPPRHVRCNCWTNHELPKRKAEPEQVREYESAEAAIKDKIKDQDFYGSDVEQVYICKDDGTLIYSGAGGGEEIDLSATGLTYGDVKDATFIHSHPTDNSALARETWAFSGQDIQFATGADLSSMVATGEFRSYIMKRPEGGWGNYQENIDAVSRQLGLSPRYVSNFLNYRYEDWFGDSPEQLNRAAIKFWNAYATHIGTQFVSKKR